MIEVAYLFTTKALDTPTRTIMRICICRCCMFTTSRPDRQLIKVITNLVPAMCPSAIQSRKSEGLIVCRVVPRSYRPSVRTKRIGIFGQTSKITGLEATKEAFQARNRRRHES